MTYHFVRHTKARNKRDCVVVLHPTPPRLSLSTALRRKYDQQRHAYVELFHDDQAKVLAFRFTNDATVPVSKVTHAGSNATVSRLSFMRKAKEFGYPMDTQLQVTQIEDGILAIEHPTRKQEL